MVGTARVADVGHLPARRWREGDVAVLDLPHLDATTAARLLERRPSAVLLAGPATSPRYPHRGPELLLAEGVVVVDDLGPHLRSVVRDGTTVRVDGGRVLVGAGRDRWVDTPEPLHGREQDLDSVAAAVEAASRSMAAQLEAFAETTGAVLQVERDLLLEGAGVPEVPVRMAGRPVVVCVPGYGHEDDLRRLRSFVADRRPVLLGVDAGADALVRAGLRPDVVVTDGDGHEVAGVEAMSSGAHVVVHTRPGGPADVPDPGPGTTRFVSHLTTEDTAILLAHEAGASSIVTVGSHATLEEFLDRGRAGRRQHVPHPAARGRTRGRRGHRRPPAPAAPVLGARAAARARRRSSPWSRPPRPRRGGRSSWTPSCSRPARGRRRPGGSRADRLRARAARPGRGRAASTGAGPRRAAGPDLVTVVPSRSRSARATPPATPTGRARRRSVR